MDRNRSTLHFGDIDQEALLSRHWKHSTHIRDMDELQKKPSNIRAVRLDTGPDDQRSGHRRT